MLTTKVSPFRAALDAGNSFIWMGAHPLTVYVYREACPTAIGLTPAGSAMLLGTDGNYTKTSYVRGTDIMQDVLAAYLACLDDLPPTADEQAAGKLRCRFFVMAFRSLPQQMLCRALQTSHSQAFESGTGHCDNDVDDFTIRRKGAGYGV